MASSRVMVRIATVSVAVSVAVMIVAMGIVAGFQKEVSYKVTGLTADITVRAHTPGNPYELVADDYDPAMVGTLQDIPGISHVQQYVVCEGIMQSGAATQGVSIKGVGPDYDWSFLRGHTVGGELPVYDDSLRSRELIVSRKIADLLELEMGSEVNIISIGESARRSRFRVSALYDSGIEEFDSQLVFADIKTLRRIQNWPEEAIDGYEARVADPQDAYRAAFRIMERTKDYSVETVRETYYQIYDWLDMLDMNTAIVIVIMFIVAGVNMICGILIIVLDSTRMIGILSAQGMRMWSIQKIFVYRSMHITFTGMILGNLAGLGLALAQQYSGVITLDPDAYMVVAVPVEVPWLSVLTLDVAVFAGITLLMMLPTMIISKITPEKSIRFQ